MSERRSCSALGVERSSVRYISHKPDQTPLVMRIRDLAATRTRYGYFRIYILLRREGWVVNHKALLSNCVQALRYSVLFLTMALSVMRSFRMVATIASLKGLPASRSRLVVAARCPLPERAMVSAAR